MNYIEKIRELLEKNNGIITAALARENNIPTVYLTRLTRDGKLKRVARGIYLSKDSIYDELFIFQTRFPKLIYSYETALYLLNLTDKLPQKIHVTVNHKYKFNQKNDKISVYYVKNEILNLGVIEKNTNIGNPVRLYGAERTLCDFIKNRSKMDPEVYINFIKIYPSYESRDIHKLFYIAQQMGVVQEVQEVMEYLL